MTSQEVKEAAKRFGADIVGIGSIDRWEGCPSQMDPRFIMPRAKSIIGLGFRVLRGSLRGIEEGTFFSNYSSMGYGGITYLYMPMTVINLAKMIEDEGYEAIPYGHQSDWRGITNRGFIRKNYSRPVAPGKPRPDVMVHLRIAGYLCGLGEIGWSKMLLTPEFGPRVRIGIVITEMELEPDPVMEPGTLCNRCMACARECPAQCIPTDRNKVVRVNLAGREVEWGDIDITRCDRVFTGAADCRKGERGEYLSAEGRYDTKPAWFSPFYHKPKNLYNTGQAVCGAKGCTRACMMSLEARGLLKNTFHNPFRTQKPWSLDWSEEGIAADQPAPYTPPYDKPDDKDLNPDVDVVYSTSTAAPKKTDEPD